MKSAHGNAVHGESGVNRTPEYSVWKGIRYRCNDPKNHSFKYYGGRGIRVCERWDRYEKFLADMGRRPSPKHSIERKDNNGDYSPQNCKWATVQEQALNSRKTRLSLQQVQDVRRLVAEGRTCAEIGRQFRVSAGHVWNLAMRQRRKAEP